MAIIKHRPQYINMNTKQPYCKLADLETEHEYKIHGFFIVSSGKYGDTAVMVIDGYNVNLPAHRLDRVKAIMEDRDSTELINNGEVYATIYEYANGGGETRRSVSIHC